MASRKGTTTIQIETKTRDRLVSIGGMRDTYDSLINKLIDLHLKKKR